MASLRVDGTITIGNATATAVTDTFTGPVYVAGAGASSVAGRVTFNAASLYAGGALTIGNTSAVASQIYSAGALTLSGGTRERRHVDRVGQRHRHQQRLDDDRHLAVERRSDPDGQHHGQRHLVRVLQPGRSS